MLDVIARELPNRLEFSKLLRSIVPDKGAFSSFLLNLAPADAGKPPKWEIPTHASSMPDLQANDSGETPKLEIPTPAEPWCMMDFFYAAQVHQWHACLSPNKVMHLKAGLNAIVKARITVRFGTGFTGCEIVCTVAKQLQRYWKAIFGIYIPMALNWSASIRHATQEELSGC